MDNLDNVPVFITDISPDDIPDDFDWDNGTLEDLFPDVTDVPFEPPTQGE